jgi:hypothetical protein
MYDPTNNLAQHGLVIVPVNHGRRAVIIDRRNGYASPAHAWGEELETAIEAYLAAHRVASGKRGEV